MAASEHQVPGEEYEYVIRSFFSCLFVFSFYPRATIPEKSEVPFRTAIRLGLGYLVCSLRSLPQKVGRPGQIKANRIVMLATKPSPQIMALAGIC